MLGNAMKCSSQIHLMTWMEFTTLWKKQTVILFHYETDHYISVSPLRQSMSNFKSCPPHPKNPDPDGITGNI